MVDSGGGRGKDCAPHIWQASATQSFFEPQSRQTAWLIFSPEEKELNGRNLSRTPSSMWKDCEATLGISSSPPESWLLCRDFSPSLILVYLLNLLFDQGLTSFDQSEKKISDEDYLERGRESIM
jgi:hypothetical protein